jgi:hypothetical protein
MQMLQRCSIPARTSRRPGCSPRPAPVGALAYHATYELYGRDAVPDIPGGKEWLAVIDERVESERHTHRELEAMFAVANR